MYALNHMLCMVALVLAVTLQTAYGALLPDNPAAIKQELRSIRKNTDWNSPAATKKANARIDALIQQLLKLQSLQEAAESQDRGEVRADEDEDKAVLTREKVWQKTQEIADKGKGAKIDMAEPVRQKIMEEYEEDRDHSIKNPAIYQELTVLVIDLSRQEAPALIGLLDKFTGIKTLVLTGGANGAPVDLPYILGKAKKLPLTELYIFNFRGFLAAVPESVGAFTGLTRLSLFNNNITRLPAAVSKMKQLEVLHVDINPITTLMPTVKGLANLTEIGVGKTKISAAEQGQLVKLLPNCRIVTQ